jgi:hypothetical protein
VRGSIPASGQAEPALAFCREATGHLHLCDAERMMNGDIRIP